MDYLPGQLGISYDSEANPDKQYDTLGLTGLKPYFSYAHQQLRLSGGTKLLGSGGLSTSHSGEHYVGQKQYELANHTSTRLRTSLGNVQVTVSDLPYRKGTNISPALKSVYDFTCLINEFILILDKLRE